MAEQVNSFEKFVGLMEENIDEVQIGVYSIAVVGLAAALRRARPFSRFTRPSDIPKRFIKTRTKLNGTVERVEPSGAFLMVQHKPLFRILRSKVDSLPVKISGISVNGNGINWLQSIVSGNNVTFIPVRKQDNCIECEVTMDQQTRDKKNKMVHVGPTLVSIGFGKVDPLEKTLSKDAFHVAYYKTLKNAEVLEEKKRLGNWYYLKSTQELSLKLARLILTSTFAMLKSVPKSVKSAKSVEKSAIPSDISAKSVEKSTNIIEKPNLNVSKVTSAPK